MKADGTPDMHYKASRAQASDALEEHARALRRWRRSTGRRGEGKAIRTRWKGSSLSRSGSGTPSNRFSGWRENFGRLSPECCALRGK